MVKFAKISRQGDVLVVEIDNPPVNALSPGVPEALQAALDAAEADANVAAVVITGAGRTFVAGADIVTLEDAAWGNEAAAPDLHGLFQRVEDCRKPVVMALHGSVLGGGLELAMAGHYRIASPDAQLGQPEVSLGIIPGGEGTQRLPRLAGIEKALDLCVTGRPISGVEAAACGIVDEVAAGDVTASAVALARRVAPRDRHVKTRDRGDRLGDANANAPLYAAARQLAGKVRRRQTAPLRAIEAIEAASRLPFEEGCRREREIFLDCLRGEQAKALIYLFFAERAASKLAGAPKDAAVRPVRTVGIAGAGTMGTGIAMACANAGVAVRLADAADTALAAGLATIRDHYEVSASRGRLTSDDVRERLARIQAVRPWEGFESADVIIEAVFEDLALKQRVFRELDGVARPDCLLATNTSTLDIDTIAAATSRPASVLGLHFFSPAPVMRLV
jgi:3-hydroxyacyl-CoA dehydrogenase